MPTGASGQHTRRSGMHPSYRLTRRSHALAAHQEVAAAPDDPAVPLAVEQQPMMMRLPREPAAHSVAGTPRRHGWPRCPGFVGTRGQTHGQMEDRGDELLSGQPVTLRHDLITVGCGWMQADTQVGLGQERGGLGGGRPC